jgi:hypothetical protein
VDPTVLRTFQHQIKTQCEFALRANHSIEEAIKNRNGPEAFYGIQNLLNAAANIRKALWGSSAKTSGDRKPLRESVETDDNSIFATRAAVRNHNEHFDERIDRWGEESKHKNFLDLNVGPRRGLMGFEEIDIFRWYDPTTGEASFWGDTFNLRELMHEINRLYPLALRESEKRNFVR